MSLFEYKELAIYFDNKLVVVVVKVDNVLTNTCC